MIRRLESLCAVPRMLKAIAFAAVCVSVIGAPTRSTAAPIAGGWGHTVALRPDGLVLTWGTNNNGQVGDPLVSHFTPMAVQREYGPGVYGPLLEPMVSVAAGMSHSLALSATGHVWAWGLNNSGQIGDGSTALAWCGKDIGLTGIVAIAAGTYHSLALGSDGTVYAWGMNGSGQLGDGTTTGRWSPTVVAGLSAVAIAAGNDYSTCYSK